MFNNIKAVIFDLDGTLINSMWLWKDIDIAYLKQFNIELPENLQNEIEGRSFTETAAFFKEKFNLKDDIETIKATWNKMAEVDYKERVTLKEGVLEFIHYLKTHQYKTGIATSNSRELLSIIVNKFDFTTYFDSIRTSCEVERGKPHPDIYLQVAMDLGVKPEECLVFEDVPKGILAGKSADMRVCAIYDDFSRNQIDYIKTISDYYIESFSDIVKWLEDHNDDNIFAN